MDAVKGGITISPDTTGQSLEAAREFLESGGGASLDGRIELFTREHHIECRVVTKWKTTRDVELFEKEVEDAKKLLAASTLMPFLKKPLKWIVIDDYEKEAVQVWPAS